MEEIIYKKENVKDEIYNGTLILEQFYRTDEDVDKQRIIEEMRNKGIEVDNPDEIEILYEGASDNDGISETQTTEYTVYRNHTIDVPYKVTRDEIYSGTLILDQFYRTDEDVDKQRIIEEMRNKGIEVDNPDEIEILYEGASDNDGISETQTTEYRVYRVREERIENNTEISEEQQEEIIEAQEDQKNEIIEEENQKEEITETREEEQNVDDDIKQVEESYSKIPKIGNNKFSFEQVLNEIAELREEFGNDVEFEQRYSSYINQIQELMESIGDKFAEAQRLISEYETTYRTLLEEINNKEKRIELIDQLNEIKEEINQISKEISKEQKKVNKTINKLENALAFGLTANEYDEIISTLNKKKIMDEILISKGLKEILDIPYKERTKEQKQRIADEKENIKREIALRLKEEEGKSVLDIIQILYSNDKNAELIENPQHLSISEEDMEKIKEVANKQPQKIQNNKTESEDNQYEPGPAPKDMQLNSEVENNFIPGTTIPRPRGRELGESDEEYVNYLREYYEDAFSSTSQNENIPVPTTTNEELNNENINDESIDAEELNNENINDENINNEENNGMIDKVTIYQDEEGRNYLRRAAFYRYFGLEEDINEVKINGAKCYEISDAEVENLESRKNNSYSPFIIQYVQATLDNEDENKLNNEEELEEEKQKIKIGPEFDPSLLKDNDSKYPRLPSNIVNDDNLNNEEIDNIVDESVEDNTDEEIPVYETTEDNSDEETPVDETTEDNTAEEIPVYETTEDNTNEETPVYETTEDNTNEETPVDETTEDNTDEETPVDETEEDNTDEEIPVDETTEDNTDEETPVDDTTEDNTNEETPVDETTEDNTNEENPVDVQDRELIDKVTIFRDLDNDGKLYVRASAYARYIGPTDGLTEVRINGALCYEIDKEDEEHLQNNKDNDYSPYIIEYVDVHLGKSQEIIEEQEEITEETIVLYRDLDDNNQIYATREILDRFGITTDVEPTEIEGKECYKLTPEQHEEIKSHEGVNNNHKINIEYKDVHLKKTKEEEQEEEKEEQQDEKQELKYGYETVLSKLEKGIDAKANDGKRYKASDIHVLKQFKDELHSGNYLYNIVHFVPGVIKAIGAGIYKFASKLFLSRKGRQAMEEVEKRLNGESENEECNLTEKDLEILFNEYIGTNVIEAKNDALNPLIIRKLREYGIQKAMKINEEITQRYNAFITAMNQIKLRKEQLNDSPENKAQLEDEINELYKFAAGLAREIRALKIEGNKILSGGGVHSLEEDFKAASTKMNYVGLGFTKEFGTDPELRQKMSELEIKLLNGNDQEAAEAFLQREKLMLDNTNVENSIFGKRSAGKRWYSPVVTYLDYNNDPFIRDLLTTVAVTTSALSIANGVYTHKVKDQEYVNQANSNINQANQANQAAFGQVHGEANKILGQRQAEIDGLQGQMMKDIRDGFNTGERQILDQHGFSFTSQYYADDSILHTSMENLTAQTQSNINSIIGQLNTGAITQSQAVQMLSTAQANLNTTINNALQPLYNASKAYAANHPQFNYDAHIVSSDWFAAHPNAFVDLGNALNTINGSAEALTQINPTLINTISQLPSDLGTTLMAGISSMVLINNVATTMKSRKYGKNTDYTTSTFADGINSLFEEEEQEEQEMQEEHSRHR